MCVEHTAQIWGEGDQYVAHAMPIDVASSGASPDEARQTLDEAVGLFLSVARERGTLHEIMEECSYEYREGSWRAPECIAIEHRSAQVAG